MSKIQKPSLKKKLVWIDLNAPFEETEGCLPAGLTQGAKSVKFNDWSTVFKIPMESTDKIERVGSSFVNYGPKKKCQRKRYSPKKLGKKRNKPTIKLEIDDFEAYDDSSDYSEYMRSCEDWIHDIFGNGEVLIDVLDTNI